MRPRSPASPLGVGRGSTPPRGSNPRRGDALACSTYPAALKTISEIVCGFHSGPDSPTRCAAACPHSASTSPQTCSSSAALELLSGSSKDPQQRFDQQADRPLRKPGHRRPAGRRSRRRCRKKAGVFADPLDELSSRNACKAHRSRRTPAPRSPPPGPGVWPARSLRPQARPRQRLWWARPRAALAARAATLKARLLLLPPPRFPAALGYRTSDSLATARSDSLATRPPPGRMVSPPRQTPG
mmetsp:Transcript_74329/g.200999  ORF Transcript_74329/g.200999 Transcript_74329/m.200999 type:complete len:242 (+) Transcript_74329:1006-1731(+)